MTLMEYLDTAERVQPQELIFGEHRLADSPTPVHQAAVAALFLALHEHVLWRRLGRVWLAPLDVVLDADRALVVQPDLFFIADGGAAIVSDKVVGPPDLVIEVLSPRPRIGDVEQRVEWFAAYGVRECWLVHQLARRIEVLQFADGAIAQRRGYGQYDRLSSAVLPEFDRSLMSIVGY